MNNLSFFQPAGFILAVNCKNRKKPRDANEMIAEEDGCFIISIYLCQFSGSFTTIVKPW